MSSIIPDNDEPIKQCPDLSPRSYLNIALRQFDELRHGTVCLSDEEDLANLATGQIAIFEAISRYVNNQLQQTDKMIKLSFRGMIYKTTIEKIAMIPYLRVMVAKFHEAYNEFIPELDISNRFIPFFESIISCWLVPPIDEAYMSDLPMIFEGFRKLGLSEFIQTTRRRLICSMTSLIGLQCLILKEGQLTKVQIQNKEDVSSLNHIFVLLTDIPVWVDYHDVYGVVLLRNKLLHTELKPVRVLYRLNNLSNKSFVIPLEGHQCFNTHTIEGMFVLAMTFDSQKVGNDMEFILCESPDFDSSEHTSDSDEMEAVD